MTPLLGRTECTYEPAMTKAFLHGRTEAIRTVQPESVEFTKVGTFVSLFGRVLHSFVTFCRRFSLKLPASRRLLPCVEHVNATLR